MLAVWVVWLIFLPKLAGWYVEKQHPLPSREAFTSAMREDRSKGIDGHNPADEREQAFKDSVLMAYDVQHLDSLPINYDGLLMQADEEYGNKVWDKHFGSLFEVMQRQKTNLQLVGLINPYGSLRSLSMGISGTEFFNGIEDFHYTNPRYTQAARIYQQDWFNLILWLVIALMSLGVATKKRESKPL